MNIIFYEMLMRERKEDFLRAAAQARLAKMAMVQRPARREVLHAWPGNLLRRLGSGSKRSHTPTRG